MDILKYLKISIIVIVLGLGLVEVRGSGNETFHTGFSTEIAGAKTYYDWNDGSFKSVDESSGQTFNYSTGEYGQDYSR